jgi:hypothetical protein
MPHPDQVFPVYLMNRNLATFNQFPPKECSLQQSFQLHIINWQALMNDSFDGLVDLIKGYAFAGGAV